MDGSLVRFQDLDTVAEGVGDVESGKARERFVINDRNPGGREPTANSVEVLNLVGD